VKRSRFSEEQIAFALKQQELGTSVEEICRKMGISDATFSASCSLPRTASAAAAALREFEF
jgi:hypothetical protein